MTRHIGYAYLAGVCGVTTQHIRRRYVKDPNSMPPRHRLPGGRKVFFLEHEIVDWLSKFTTNKKRRGRPRRCDRVEGA